MKKLILALMVLVNMVFADNYILLESSSDDAKYESTSGLNGTVKSTQTSLNYLSLTDDFIITAGFGVSPKSKSNMIYAYGGTNYDTELELDGMALYGSIYYKLFIDKNIFLAPGLNQTYVDGEMKLVINSLSLSEKDDIWTNDMSLNLTVGYEYMKDSYFYADYEIITDLWDSEEDNTGNLRVGVNQNLGLLYARAYYETELNPSTGFKSYSAMGFSLGIMY